MGDWSAAQDLTSVVFLELKSRFRNSSTRQLVESSRTERLPVAQRAAESAAQAA
jgi:hypothetical protein